MPLASTTCSADGVRPGTGFGHHTAAATVVVTESHVGCAIWRHARPDLDRTAGADQALRVNPGLQRTELAGQQQIRVVHPPSVHPAPGATSRVTHHVVVADRCNYQSPRHVPIMAEQPERTGGAPVG